MAIFGYSTLGISGTQLVVTSGLLGSRFVASSSGTITSATVYISSTGTANFQIALFNDSSGAPDTLISTSSVGTMTTTPTWVTLPLSATITIGQTYWLAAQGDDYLILNYNIGSTNQGAEINIILGNAVVSYPTVPSPPTGVSYFDNKYTIYATYTESTIVSRPFAYNPGSAITGATQFSNIAIGTSALNYPAKPGGVQWWSGPDEANGYIIAKPIPSGTQPNSINRIYANGVTASVGFNRSLEKTDDSFLNLAKSVFNQTFTTATIAKNWLLANGYWTSYPILDTITRLQRLQTYIGSSVTATVTAGSLLIVSHQGDGSSPSGISDTAGNTWTKGQEIYEVNGRPSSGTAIWYCWNCTGGATIITVTGYELDTSVNLYEYSGVENTYDPIIDSAQHPLVTGNTVGISISTQEGGLMFGYWGNQVDGLDYGGFIGNGNVIFSYGGASNAAFENLSTLSLSDTMTISVGAVVGGGSSHSMFSVHSFRAKQLFP